MVLSFTQAASLSPSSTDTVEPPSVQEPFWALEGKERKIMALEGGGFGGKKVLR